MTVAKNTCPADLLAIFTELHQYPELSNLEFATTERITRWLTEKQIKILDFGLETGVIAEIGDSRKGPTIALRADIDALPIEEQSAVSYPSKNKGVMHACGHDFHTTALLGAAFYLKALEDQLPGCVRLIFQPAEECSCGADRLVKAGVLQNVTQIVGIHNKADEKVGTIGLKPGPLMSAVDHFEVRFKGIGGHAAMPDKTRDPILTAGAFLTNVQSIVSRNVSPLEQAVVSVTHICGGDTWNVIPEMVYLEGTIRSFSNEIRHFAKKRFVEVAENTAATYEVVSQVDYLAGGPSVYNDPELTEKIRLEAAKHAHVVTPELCPAGEDFSFYQEQIPGVFAFIGSESPYDWHHPKFQVNPDGIPVAVQFYLDSVTALLEN